jgi:hypothetical protein
MISSLMNYFFQSKHPWFIMSLNFHSLSSFKFGICGLKISPNFLVLFKTSLVQKFKFITMFKFSLYNTFLNKTVLNF